MRDLVNACWFAFKWGLLVALVAAVAVGLYVYSHLNDEIRLRIQSKFAVHYANLQVTLRSAQLIDGKGIEVRGLSIVDPRADDAHAELAYFDEIFLCCETTLQDLLQHEPTITRVLVRRPRLHASRLPDGCWNLSQLLPLPKFSDRAPNMTIEGGELLVSDPLRNPPALFTARDINLEIGPASSADPNLKDICEVRGYLAADHVQRVDLAGRLDHASGAFDVNGAVSGIDISPELLALLPPDWAARLQGVALLRGQAKLDFRVAGREGSPLQFNVAGQLVSGRFDDPRLPQALADMHADFRADNRGIVVDQLTARNGPTTIRLAARLDGYQPGAGVVVEGEALHLLIGRQWEAILPGKLLEQWRKFLPAGEVNVKNGRLVFDGLTWRPEGKVECLNVSFTYHKFPYRLERGTGALTLKDNRLTLDLAAFASGRQVKIDGQFLNPGPQFTGWVTLQGADLPLDHNLYAALPDKSREVLQSLNPTGTFNFSVEMRREDPDAPRMSQHLIATLNNCSVRYDKFAYPLSNIVGRLEMVDGHWLFRDLQGTNDTGRVTCQGRLTPLADGAELYLEFQGRDVVLEEELRDALAPPMQRLWNDLKPKGSINLAADVNYRSTDKRVDVQTRIEPAADTVSVHPTFFPYRLEKLQGAITFRDGRADFENLRALHDRTPVSTSGYCEHDADGRWHARFDKLSVDRLMIDRDRDLIVALPARLRKALVQINPSGMLSLRGALDFWGQPAALAEDAPLDVAVDGNLRTAWDLEIDLQQATLRPGIDLENVNGSVALVGDCDGQHVRSRGELNVDSVTWRGFQFTDVRGPIWLDDQQAIFGSQAEPQQPGRLPRRLSAKAFGGLMMADARVTLEDTPRYTVQTVISDADLNRFCVEAMPGRQKLKGKVLAGVDLSGTAAGLHTLSGRGEVRLHDADVYELPLMVSLLKVLNLRRPDATAFTTSNILFRVEGEHVLLENIEFSGDAISLVGKGEMNLNTDIRLTLHSIVGRSDIQLPVWKTLVGGASEQIMQIHVTGTLADPETRREAFPSMRQALQSIQASMQPPESRRAGMFPEGMRLLPRADDAQRR